MSYLSYGNPTKDLVELLEQKNYLDSLEKEIYSYAPPAPTSNESQEELKQLVENVKNLSEDKLTEKRYIFYDKSFDLHIANSLEKQGIEKSEIKRIFSDLYDDITPLLVKTKFHFQRVRPYQLAYFYNVPLYPYPSLSANNPSYPSGHAFQAKVFAIVLGNKYPLFYKPLMELADDIANSRFMMGLHYKSDIDFANYMAELVTNHPDFKKKYEL
jgi:hypothetical protein